MGGVAGKLCTVIAIAGTAAGVREMTKRYYTKKTNIVPWKPVGRITELAIFPLMQGPKMNLPKAYCTKNGLRSTLDEKLQDGCFLIYESENTDPLPVANYCFNKIRVECKLDRFVLKAPKSKSLSIPFDKLSKGLNIVVIHKGEVIPIRDCGGAAARWVTGILSESKKKLCLGYYNMNVKQKPPLPEIFNQFFNGIEIFTGNALVTHPSLTNPLLINEDSIAGVATTMNKYLNPYDFNANIVIRYSTGYPLEEYTWKKVKIGDVEFDCIKPCENCLISRGSLYSNRNDDSIDMKKFMMILKSALQKYAGFKIRDTPFIGINLKLSGDEGVINHNDEVFALC